MQTSTLLSSPRDLARYLRQRSRERLRETERARVKSGLELRDEREASAADYRNNCEVSE